MRCWPGAAAPRSPRRRRPAADRNRARPGPAGTGFRPGRRAAGAPVPAGHRDRRRVRGGRPGGGGDRRAGGVRHPWPCPRAQRQDWSDLPGRLMPAASPAFLRRRSWPPCSPRCRSRRAAASADRVRSAADRRDRDPAVRDGRHVPRGDLHGLLGRGAQPVPQRRAARRAVRRPGHDRRFLDRVPGAPGRPAPLQRPAGAGLPGAPQRPGRRARAAGDAGRAGEADRRAGQPVARHRADRPARAGRDLGHPQRDAGRRCVLSWRPSTRRRPGAPSSGNGPASPASCTTW